MEESVDRTAAEHIGVLVKETQAILNQRMSERLRPLGLSVPQYACLQALCDDPGITGSELARRAFVSRQSMNVLLQALAQRGLVERADEPGPRRERLVSATTEAEHLVARAHAEVAEVVDTMTAGVDVEDAVRLRALLTGCRDALLEG